MLITSNKIKWRVRIECRTVAAGGPSPWAHGRTSAAVRHQKHWGASKHRWLKRTVTYTVSLHRHQIITYS